MRTVPAELAARMDSGAASLAHVWIVTRSDAVRLGFTDHDQDLVVDGVSCSAASGWTAGAAESELGLSAGMASTAGALDSETITRADVSAGLYDSAIVDCFRLDWTEPELRVRLWRGTIRRLSLKGDAYTAEIDGPLAALERVIGRTFTRTCDANLGDARCGVDLDAFPGAVCDKRFATCRGTFTNGLNFRGFPTIPGEDFLTTVPAQGERNDGGKR